MAKKTEENVDLEDVKETEIPETKEEELDYSVDQLEGVGAVTKKKLEAFGLTSIIDICVRGAKEVSEIAGVDKHKADSWVFGCQKILEDKGFIRKSDMSTVELMEYQENLPSIETKAKGVDELLGGGIKPEATYEIYGEFGSGKTQFCNSLTVETIHNGQNVIWIDCEDTFKPRRIVEILMGTINNLSNILMEKSPPLLILDGAIGQFREEYLGRGTLAERQMQLARLMTHLKNISYYFRNTVVFTNQVQSDPAMMFGDPIKPIGGNVVGHASTYRIYFKKSGKKRVARMVDSPEHPQADAEFVLGVEGLKDPE
jgi:DNA repair protein RadA